MAAGIDIKNRVSISQGQIALKQLIDRLTEQRLDWNEAETRFQFIDPFLTDCLGWHRLEITPEKSEGGTYADYEIGRPRAVIWEAKREGKYFELPANPSQKLVTTLRSVVSLCPEADDAVKQAQLYCSSRGVQFAVVCNGHQFIVFLAVRFDGIAPLDGQCLVIDGYSHLTKEFPAVWQYLSPEGIGERKLTRLLTTGIMEGIPPKLCNFLTTYSTSVVSG